MSSAGVGKAMSEWDRGRRAHDGSVRILDIARFHNFEINERFLHDRISESLGLLYAMHWPHRQFDTARGIRETPLYSRLKERGAVFGTAAGWERANWYVRDGVKREYEYSFARQNWFECVRAEHDAARNAVAVFDMSTFGKTFIEGADAEAEMQRICANNVAVAPGKIVYTQMLNSRGGIVADVTVTRLSETRYMMGDRSGDAASRHELGEAKSEAGFPRRCHGCHIGFRCYLGDGPEITRTPAGGLAD